MPSIISRIRRGSENGSPKPEVDGNRSKRLSIDVGKLDQNHDESPKSSKFKGIFGHKHEGDGPGTPNKMDSLRKKLTSPSTIFKSQPAESDRPITPPPDNDNDPTLARYSAAMPLTPPRNSQSTGSTRFPSPATSPQRFALSTSRSPEGGSHRNSWTPSYPLVVPDDDGYADISPDGHSTSPPKNTVPLAPSISENHRRRSVHLDRPTTLDDWVPIEPIRPNVATLKISPESGLPTPPTSIDSRDTIPTTGRPSLSLDTDAARPIQPAETTEQEQSTTTSTTSEATPVALAAPFSPTPTSPSLTTPSTPEAATAMTGVTRPPKPTRQRTNLITSPPMPQPIKNLPTLSGWSGFNTSSPSTPRTPGWGSLAREGGPKTPGGMMSSPRTPGGSSGGFPFMSLPMPRQTSRGPMSDGELRKAKRAMPVMLREPSFKPPTQEDGEVGASDDDEDDDEESETEVEAGGDHNDSDDETATERAQRKDKGKNKAVPLSQRLKGKNKGKTAASPSVGITAVSEEADSPPATGSGATSSSANQSTPNSSMWSLPTPKEKTMSSVWASFRSGTPGSAGPQRPDNSDHTRSSSYQTSNGSYFDSQPGSSVNLTTSSLAVEATAQSLAINAPRDPATNIIPPPPVETVEEHDEDGSDGGNETSSSHDNSSMTHASPQAVSPTALPDTTTPNRPENTTRPSMYHQLSQSMVNFGSSDEGPATAGLGADRASTRPQLETIRSREGAPTKIEIPKPAQMTNTPLFSPGAEWAKPPPTPAAGFAGVFWNRKDGDKPALKRRRSAGDTEGAPPGYEPPHPGVVIPRPRDEEGREKLPEYWCAVHIEGTLSRKMEFSAPGVQSRDRSWKKHYYILRGTALFVYKFDPHRFPLKTDHAIVPTTNEHEWESNLHVHMPGERRLSNANVVASDGSSPRRSSLDSSATATGSSSTVGGGTRRGSISSALSHIAPIGTDGRRGSLPGPSPLSAGATHARRISGASATSTSGPPPAPSASASGSTSTSIAGGASGAGPDTKDTALFNKTPRKPSVSSLGSATSQSTSIASHFQQNQLLRVYTLQNAESGLAADYVKRKNVVRVRSEGEQFLLQTDSARDVVDWIEAFQSATNVALDLDDRPMPKIITLPRRRRRRVPGAPGAAAAGAAGGVAGAAVNAPASDAAPPTVADTPEGNAAAVAAAEAASRERERMLAEDQSGAADRT